MTYESPPWVDVPPGTPVPDGAPALDSENLRNLTDTVEALDAAAALEGALNPTPVKAANYTIVAGQLVPFDLTAASRIGTLPTTPPDKSQVLAYIKLFGTGHSLTLTAGGSDLIEQTTGGTGTSVTRSAGAGESIWLQYDHANALWRQLPDRIPLSVLDGRYAPPTDVATYYVSASARASDSNNGAGWATPFATITAAIAAAAAASHTVFKVEVGPGNFVYNTPVAFTQGAGGTALLSFEGVKVYLRGSGKLLTSLITTSATATEFLHLGNAGGSSVSNLQILVQGTAQIQRGLNNTCTNGLSSEEVDIQDVLVIGFSGPHQLSSLSPELPDACWIGANSQTLLSAMYAFSAADVGAQITVSGQLNMIPTTITATAVNTTTAVGSNASATAIPLNATLLGITVNPGPGFTVLVNATGEILFVSGVSSAGLTLNVMRGFAGTTAATIPANATLTVYSATTAATLGPGGQYLKYAAINKAPNGSLGTSYLGVGFGIGADTIGDIAQMTLKRCKAFSCMIAGVQAGNGTQGNVLDNICDDFIAYACASGVWMNQANVKCTNHSFSGVGVVYKLALTVAETQLVQNVRSENHHRLVEFSPSGTPSVVKSFRSIQTSQPWAPDLRDVIINNAGTFAFEDYEVHAPLGNAALTGLVDVRGLTSHPAYLTMHRCHGVVPLDSTQPFASQIGGMTLPTSVVEYSALTRTDDATPTTGRYIADKIVQGQPAQHPVVAKTGAYSVAVTDEIVLCSGTFTVTLLAPAAANAGQSWRIINNGSGVITVAPASGQINGLASVTLAPGVGVSCISDGSNYWTDRAVSGANLSTTVITSTNASWPIPAGAAVLEITTVGSGGGGGGGGAAALTGGSSAQSGGSGGTAGCSSTQVVAVGANTTLNVTVGVASGPAAAGGIASTDTNGHAGATGPNGGDTTVTATGISVTGKAGFGGGGGPANATSQTVVTPYGASTGGGTTGGESRGNISAGTGGTSFGSVPQGYPGGAPVAYSPGGGGGGGVASATLGGLGGAAGAVASGGAAGANAGSGTAAGGAGTAGAVPGAPGGGGGGGAPGGAGGAGGLGSNGMVIIKVVG